MNKIIFVTFFILSTILPAFGEEVPVSIPHYEKYPRTPMVDYQEEILDFYSVTTAYGEFSNFALFPFVLEGKVWPSSEHYFQAMKYLDPDLQEKVRLAKTPYEAAVLGRDPNLPKREDWDEYRLIVMNKALHAKFSSYQVLQDLLKSTNHAKLFEHTKNDCYWADCFDRTGENKLGHMLEDLRAEISASQN
jgi:ribA/ribD-fused uncharacterized protein